MSITRRTFGSAAAVGVSAVGLAACSPGTDTAKDPAASSPTQPTPSETASSDSQTGSATALAAAADIPVGGCAVFGAQQVVVTQPHKGEFKAFSSVCTHSGCQVSNSADGVIPCKCHGSEFSLSDGSVLKGPATQPLGSVDITVKGDEISLA